MHKKNNVPLKNLCFLLKKTVNVHIYLFFLKIYESKVVFMLEVKYYVYKRKNDTYYTQNNT